VAASQTVPLGELDDTLTSPSMFVREVLPLPAPVDHTIFHEIVPCRLADTRLGAGAFIQNESRTYDFINVPSTNDCYEKIPTSGVVALTLQLTSYNDGAQVGYLLFNTAYVPQLLSPRQYATGFLLYEDLKTVVQAGTVAVTGETFTIMNRNGTTNLTIDILGYHFIDTLVGTAGAQGPPGVGIQGPPGQNGQPGICVCPWGCGVCGAKADSVNRSAEIAVRPLWPQCNAVLPTDQPFTVSYVKDGVPYIVGYARGSHALQVDFGSTYCVLSLPSSQ
jgi:hypothetical protein